MKFLFEPFVKYAWLAIWKYKMAVFFKMLHRNHIMKLFDHFQLSLCQFMFSSIISLVLCEEHLMLRP